MTETDSGDYDDLHRDQPNDSGLRDDDETAPRRRHRVRKALIALLACVVALAVIAGGAGLYLQHKLSSQIDRIPDAFAGLTSRPDKPTTGDASKAINILLMGSDRRSDKQTTGAEAKAKSWIPGEQRSDTLMVLHVDGDRKGMSVVSIPRDSWVTIPGYGSNKINAAFSFAGPSLAVQTVENLTNLRIDHVALIDWEGFEKLTDALGGVTIQIPETVYDSARKKTWTKGVHRMDGKEALLYVRQRHGLVGGDFDRIKRQQNFLRTLLGETLSGGTMKSPAKIYHVLNSVTSNLSVDSGWSTGDMRGLALSLRKVHSSDVKFTTVPLKGTGREGQQSVVYLDRPAGAGLWGAMREDRVAQWIAKHPGTGLSSSVS